VTTKIKSPAGDLIGPSDDGKVYGDEEVILIRRA